MVTKAQLDAALDKLEDKLVRRLDMRLDLLEEKEAGEEMKQRALAWEASLSRLEDELRELETACSASRDDLHELRSRLERLETILDQLLHGFPEEPAIKDEL